MRFIMRGAAMNTISLDFDKLLGFKLTLRALQAMQPGAGQATDEQGGANRDIEMCSAILRSRIGIKAPTGLRYRRTN